MASKEKKNRVIVADANGLRRVQHAVREISGHKCVNSASVLLSEVQESSLWSKIRIKTQAR